MLLTAIDHDDRKAGDGDGVHIIHPSRPFSQHLKTVHILEIAFCPLYVLTMESIAKAAGIPDGVSLYTEGELLAQFADGPALIGILFNTMLYGAMITQTFFYFSSYKRDPSWMKFYVAVLLLNDTLNTVFNIWWIYDVLINNFGNVEALGRGNWLFETEEAMAGIIAMQVQFYYAWRIKKLTQNWWLTLLVIIPSVTGGLAGIGTAIGVAIIPDFSQLQKLKPVVLTWLIGAAVADVIIALILIWHLRNNRTKFLRTNQMLSRLVQLIMSNGLLTASLALADIISYLATTKGYHIGFNYALVKLYGNSVMSSLNARSLIANASSSQNPYSDHDSTSRQNDVQLVSTGTRGRAAQVVVSVERHELTDVAMPTLKHGVDWPDDMHHIGDDYKTVA
ncbi:uncharacterized protein C8Q71DRAFT_902765 [Rhodofomes roseus]|uniref:DUF6534 domain-containing protein n=1 Tax=Rhodofomes roseus TaxID=34475 RepID=A0ABQ8KYI8_9APHY|nr:uncharacterized protein C8Q71DRAFT_902765 [Rhodofomes roseus]KAH9843577.1 hypothetical protein C8Q71DRAFT_902765 [Rhodofomes roseus]